MLLLLVADFAAPAHDDLADLIDGVAGGSAAYNCFKWLKMYCFYISGLCCLIL